MATDPEPLTSPVIEIPRPTRLGGAGDGATPPLAGALAHGTTGARAGKILPACLLSAGLARLPGLSQVFRRRPSSFLVCMWEEAPTMSDMPAAPEPWVEVTSSHGFPAWLAEQRVSLAFTTYQAGKLFFLGLHPDGRL